MKTLILLIGFISVTIHFSEAQQSKRLPRIGYLAAGSPEVASARIEAFRQGLRELGYIEGQDILIEYRNAAGKPEQVPPNVAELVPGGYALAG
jgi:putative ABC transport system substrate-binding protein